MSTSRNKVKAARGGPNRRAAPAGGALQRGRGCHLFFSALALACLSHGVWAQDEAQLSVPSGQPVYLLGYVDETGSDDAIFRARYVAPALQQFAEDFELVLGDLEHLCNRQALPNVTAAGLEPARIVVSLSAEPLDLGVIAPDIVQVFESYTIKDGTCMWEIY